MDKNILLGRNGLFLKEQETLVIADLHIGLEEAMNRQGILVPRLQQADLVQNLQELLVWKPKTVVIAGDLKHEFGDISDQEWRDTLKVLDLLTKQADVVLVKGNHDTILGPIAGKRKLIVSDHHDVGGYYICHGDQLPNDSEFKTAHTVIIGHEHPAVSLKSGARTETFKCYLIGEYKGKALVVLPSISSASEGTDVLTGEILSPLIKDIGGFRVVVFNGKLFDFGLLRDL